MKKDNIDKNKRTESEAFDTKPAFDIIVKNAHNGLAMMFYVTEENWLIQALEGTMHELGINPDHKATYYRNVNDRVTSDGTMTIGEFDLKEGSILYIEQDASGYA